MEEHGVVPLVLDQVPPNKIHIKYGGKYVVDNGNELKPLNVIDPPTEITWPTEPNSYYSLVMVDPDGPSRANPTSAEVKHWLIVNIPGNDLNNGQELAMYTGSKPPPNSGIHRYTFVVFKQPSGLITPDEVLVTPTSPREARRHFNVRKFAVKYNLGQPIAGNFYTSQADEYSTNFWANMNAGK